MANTAELLCADSRISGAECGRLRGASAADDFNALAKDFAVNDKGKGTWSEYCELGKVKLPDGRCVARTAVEPETERAMWSNFFRG